MNKETTIMIKMNDGNAILRNGDCLSMVVINGVLTLRDGITIDDILIENIKEVTIR